MSWIRTEDRLPIKIELDAHGCVLASFVASRTGERFSAIVPAKKLGKSYTHWMQLPAHPAGDEGKHE